MPLNTRSPEGQNVAAHTFPISRSFAVTILFALLGLIILRHLFGSVRLEAGVS